MTWKAPQWRQRHEADSHRLWLRTPTYISGVLTKRNSVRCFSLIGDIKEELALISSSQCKQRFFGVSSNYYLKWWYTFYDWNSVDIISPDIYQKENGEVHVGWSKGSSPLFFFSIASMKIFLGLIIAFRPCVFNVIWFPQQKSRRSITLSPRNKEKTPKEEISKQYIWISMNIEKFGYLESFGITLVLIVAQSAEQHVMQKTTYYHISLNLIKIHKTADYPFLFADLIFFWSPPFKTHITGCIYLSKSGVNMFWYKTRTSEFQRAFLCKIKR